MLITIEGIEGSGKTTQIEHITDFLKHKGIDHISTREPGATAIGRKIRGILLDPESRDMSPLAELLLYLADRVEHVKETIRPALSEGKTVLCDRFHDATVVYQGLARGIDLNLIKDLHKVLLDGIQPDITLLLDLSPEDGLARAWKQIEDGSRTDMETRFERETLRFHEMVRAGYLKLAKEEPERFRIIDAAQDEETVRLEIQNTLSLLYD